MVSQVPHSNSLVSRASGQDVLAKQVERQAVHFSCMSIDNLLCLRAVVTSLTEINLKLLPAR